MTNKKIQYYINVLNNNDKEIILFKRKISKNVELVKIWDDNHFENDSIVCNYDPLKFFFIKNELGDYVGAVYVMINDLYWYINKKHRNNKYMSNALREAVLPYLFMKEKRKSINISIDSCQLSEKCYNNSRLMALNQGFKLVSQSKINYKLLKSNFCKKNNKLSEENYQIKTDRLEQLRKQVFSAHITLSKISDELLMAYGFDSGLSNTAKEVKEYIHILQDEYK